MGSAMGVWPLFERPCEEDARQNPFAIFDAILTSIHTRPRGGNWR
jgi:hypothetical protein